MSSAAGPLDGVLQRAIREEGPLPFSRFQEIALYHAEHGYYTTRPAIGREHADFWTAPEMDPAFGELVGVQVEEMAARLAEPKRFRMLEFGAGTGRLADALLTSLQGRGSSLYRKDAYVIMEKSPALRRQQEATLARHGDVVRHAGGETAPLERVPGVVIMNEVLDALPVDRVRMGATDLMEIRIGLAGGTLAEIEVPAPPRLRDEMARRLPGREGLVPGQEAELRPELTRFLQAATRPLDRGYVLLIDYGMEARELFHPSRPRGTLMAYSGHRAGEDWLTAPGSRDITAHVDWTAVRESLRSLDLTAAALTTQMRFLLALGLGERIEALEEASLSEAERIRRRLSLAALIRPGGMGEMFQVLVAARDAPLDLSGLRDPLAPLSA